MAAYLLGHMSRPGAATATSSVAHYAGLAVVIYRTYIIRKLDGSIFVATCMFYTNGGVNFGAADKECTKQLAIEGKLSHTDKCEIVGEGMYIPCLMNIAPETAKVITYVG